MSMTPPQEPPPGCQEVPGFILTLKSGGWLTKEGFPTWRFEERGAWPTQAEAEAAMAEFTKESPSIPPSESIESLRTQLEGVLRANKGLAEKVKRLESAGDGIAPWLSAAIEDPMCCEEFKVAIRQWFAARP